MYLFDVKLRSTCARKATGRESPTGINISDRVARVTNTA